MKTVFVTRVENPMSNDQAEIAWCLDRWDNPVIVIRAGRDDIPEIVIASALNGLEDEWGDGTCHLIDEPIIHGEEEIVIDEALPASYLAFFLRQDPSWRFEVKTWTSSEGIQDL